VLRVYYRKGLLACIPQNVSASCSRWKEQVNVIKTSFPVRNIFHYRSDYERLLPPKSFLYVKDFPSYKDLAKFLKFLGGHDEFYLRFHQWRKWYRVRNEQGFFNSKSHQLCRVCEALNYNEWRETKFIHDFDQHWSVDRDCLVV
jgi:hypothetical protein